MFEDHARRELFLERLCSMPVTEEIVDIMVSIVNAVIPCAPAPANAPLPSLTRFVRQMCERSRVSAGSVFACITYIERLRSKLPQTAKGMYCTAHRIFLSSLVCANKYCNDTPLRNKQWSRLTSFSLQEVNLMERQLLFLLNFELAISPDSLVDICVRYYHPVEVLAMHRSTYKPRSIPPKALGDVNPAGLSRPKEVSSSVETLVSSPTDAKSFSDISGDSEMETIDLNSAIKDAEAAIRHSNRTSAVLSDVVPMRGNGHSDTLPPLPASQTGSRAAVNGSTGKGMERTLPRAMSSQATMGSSGSDRGLASSVGCYSTDRLDTLSASELHVNIGQRTAFRPKTHGILNASIDSIDLIELGPAPPAPSQTSNESAPKSSFRRSIWSVLRA